MDLKICEINFTVEHPRGGGGQPQIHTFLKVWIFKGGWGVLGPISTLFCPILFFFKNFVLFYPVFVGWKVIFRVKLKKIFFPPKCVSTLQGGRGGGGRGGGKKSTLFIFFEGFPYNCSSAKTTRHLGSKINLLIFC